MPVKGWRTISLGEFATLQRGHDLPEGRRRPGRVPVLGSFGITGWHDEARAPGPGVTVGRSGASFGVVSYSTIDYWPLNTALYVTDFHGNDPRFAYYFLKQFDFRRFNSGSAQPSLNRNFVHPAPVNIPPLGEQQTISGLLGVLDDKIELNRCTTETLEAVAKALFKSWFVDFDPVRAKAEGRPTGLPDQLAALFSSRLGDDGLPQGWAACPLSELVEVDRETVDPAELNGSSIAYYSIAAFDAGRRPINEMASNVKSLKFMLRVPVVLFSKLNPETSRVWPVLDAQSYPMLASTEFINLRHRVNKITPSFLTCLLSCDPFRERSASMATGTSKSHQRIQVPALLSTAWHQPPKSVLVAFDAVAGQLLMRSEQIRGEMGTLAALRDVLAPKLISGELRISDAEKQIAAA